MALGEEVRRRGSKRRQQQMDIMRACVLRASRKFHVENPLFHITYFHYQQRKLSAQGSFIGCTLTFCVKMSGGHVCVVTMLSCSTLLCSAQCPTLSSSSAPQFYFLVKVSEKSLTLFLEITTFEVLSVAWIIRDSAV